MATPNMNLVELVASVTPGPQYATDQITNYDIIDAHDHTTGSGVKVPSGGININADLPYGGNGATGLGKSQYNSLGAALSGSDNYRSVHVVAGELYYLDASGNAVQMTSGGSVAGSAGNITGLVSPATVTFSTNKYTFKDTANSFAVMESADIRLFEDAAGAITNHVVMRSPGSLAATYTMTMPAAVPATSLEYLSMTSAGVVEPVTSNELVDTVTRATGTSVGNLGVAASTSSSNFSTTSSSPVDVTNLSVTITTSGRPVKLCLIAADGSTGSFVRINAATGPDARGKLNFFRDAAAISEDLFGLDASTGSNPAYVDVPPAAFAFVDFPGAGTYTYKVQCDVELGSGTTTLSVNHIKLVAYEL